MGRRNIMIEKLKFEQLNLHQIGNELEIVGVVYGTDRRNIVIMLPDEGLISPVEVMNPTLDEWQQIVRQSDLKETEGMIKDQKIILRKSTRQIETKIMWEVFRRDDFTCRYCNADQVPMTVDHVVLWEEMGPSVPINLITSCKKCNNARSNMEYEEWLGSPYYLSKVPKIPVGVLAANARVTADIPHIKRNLLRTVKRSR